MNMNWLKKLFGCEKKEAITVKQEIKPTPHWHISHRQIDDYDDGHLVDVYEVKYGNETVSTVFDSYSDAYEMMKELFDNDVITPYKGYHILGYVDKWAEDNENRFIYDAYNYDRWGDKRIPRNGTKFLSCKDLIKAIDVREGAFKEIIDINGDVIG